MTNRYLENTHVFYSSLNSEQSIQSIMWYENSTSINLTVRNQNKKGLGGKSAEIRLSPVDAQKLITILQNYISKSEATHA